MKKEEKKQEIDPTDKMIKDTAEKVEAALKKEFPDYLHFDDTTFTIEKGSTQVMVGIRKQNKTEVFIDCMANVVYNAELTEDLMKFMLRKNSEFHFGKFALLFDDTIVFSHSIAAAALNDEELISVVKFVAGVADRYDDAIVNTNGGQRATDLNPVID